MVAQADDKVKERFGVLGYRIGAFHRFTYGYRGIHQDLRERADQETRSVFGTRSPAAKGIRDANFDVVGLLQCGRA